MAKGLFLKNLSELKNGFQHEIFGFLRNDYVDYKQIQIKDDGFEITRNPHMLRPLRGVGLIKVTVEQRNDGNLDLNYSINAASLLIIQILPLTIVAIPIGIMLFMAPMLNELWFYFGALSLFGLIIWISHKHNERDLDRYLQQVVEEVRSVSNN